MTNGVEKQGGEQLAAAAENAFRPAVAQALNQADGAISLNTPNSVVS
jgi:hypothetical protein